MNARVLLFPLCAAVVVIADGCAGVSINDPMVKVCHDDTLAVSTIRRADGSVTEIAVIQRADQAHCRKAA